MVLKVLFIQRNCSYDGEFAPEAMVCVDEYCYDECPNWFDNRVEEVLNQQDTDICSHAIIDINISQEKIASFLNNNLAIKGEING